MAKGTISAVLFFICCSFLAYWTGFATAFFRLPPFALVDESYAELSDLTAYWRNDFGIEPTRFLVPAVASKAPPEAPGTKIPAPDTPGFNAINPAAMSGGYRLVAGYFPNRSTLNGALLFDPNGNEVHFWPINYATLDPKGRDPRLVFLHGFEVFPDGSIVVSFDNGGVIARIGACGDTRWVQHGDFHHSVTRSYDGTLWALEASRIVQLDSETGARLRQIEFREDIIDRNDAVGIFGMRFRDDELKPGYMDDPFHPNDVEVLSPAMAGAFPQFKAGDIMFSMRSLNLVAVVDGQNLKLKWYQHGPWHRQHDPDFLPDGTISVFDNNMHGRSSRIVTMDPATRDYRVAFEGSDAVPFYTWIRGKHQHLPNGNILITEPQGGRAFEVDAKGHLVWSYRNAFDEDRNLLLSEVVALPPDFFQANAFSTCDGNVIATN